ncbi:hypothetical protein DV515_00015575 [Chloebia gouldiae]|uniref:Uncharacterized protein n=1 Tax=Chloebia gouldiae TaxID=44316 RepID=A0A3L8RVG9_CHLGU|nr:hypothetical protein DV515_00015575 [Chloebia gouldiae]
MELCYSKHHTRVGFPMSVHTSEPCRCLRIRRGCPLPNTASRAQPEKMNSLQGNQPSRVTREPSLQPQPPCRTSFTPAKDGRQREPAPLWAPAGKDVWGVI